jgi:hypothetical protein
VEALAADLRSHLDGQAVQAQVPTLVYRARKFLLRHRITVTAVAISILSMAVVAAAIVVVGQRVRNAARAAVPPPTSWKQLPRDLARSASPEIRVQWRGRNLDVVSPSGLAKPDGFLDGNVRLHLPGRPSAIQSLDITSMNDINHWSTDKEHNSWLIAVRRAGAMVNETWMPVLGAFPADADLDLYVADWDNVRLVSGAWFKVDVKLTAGTVYRQFFQIP